MASFIRARQGLGCLSSLCIPYLTPQSSRQLTLPPPPIPHHSSSSHHHQVAGLCPYEKRLLDMIKSGGTTSEKRVYKLAKRRLGTHKRALKKREELKEYIAKVRARAA